MSRPVRFLIIGSAVAALAGAGTAQAEPRVEGRSAEAPSPFGVKPIAERSLRRIAGREDLSQLSRAELAATVTNNKVGDNSRTGDLGVSDNAFQNMSGLSIVNINSGNNVAINAAMNVNISINPGQ